MKITILTAGTRGDVQPYIALARGLKAAGHEPRVATGTNFESFVRDYGVDYAPLSVDYYQLSDSPEGRQLKSGNPLKTMSLMKTVVYPLIRRMLDDAWAASKDADCIIYHPKAMAGAHIAEKLNIPVFTAMAVPLLTPTGAFPAPGLVNRSLGGWLNKKTFSLLNLAMAPFNGLIAAWRQEKLGLPGKSSVVKGFTIQGHPIPALYAYSPAVLPVPSDWPDSAHVTGYWFLDSPPTWQPSADLLAFLAGGPAPVYVGFGSMIADDPERITKTVIAALEQSGQRGVIATGWGGLQASDLPPSIFRLAEAPHDWLFPRLAAVVHHGGAGTVAAGLRAGKPTVVCPFMVDQPFWGRVIAERGLGPKPIPQQQLTVDGLAQAIRVAATDTGMRQRAEQIGTQIRAEDGVGTAVEIIDTTLRLEKRPAVQSLEQ